VLYDVVAFTQLFSLISSTLQTSGKAAYYLLFLSKFTLKALFSLIFQYNSKIKTDIFG